MYQHHFSDGRPCDWPLGKIVCVGRNYAAHARELGNAVPASPLLFIKPATAAVPVARPFGVPAGTVHHELEIALLIGQPLKNAREADCLAAVAGVGLALDLTRRDLQDQLKAAGQPWELAKAFDGSCPLSDFIPREQLGDLQDLHFALDKNGAPAQRGHSADQIHPAGPLLAYISQHFTLLPGDVVLTGTPAGVGPLAPGDRLRLSMQAQLVVETACV